MIKFQPVKDYIILERSISRKSALVMPDKADPVSDDIFEITAVGPGDQDNPQVYKVGDTICLIGYINTFSYKGEKVILARARDVAALVLEE